MTVVFLILLLLAAVCFVAATFGVVARKLNLVALGLFFWSLVPLIHTAQAL